MVVENKQSSEQMHHFSFKKEPLEICKLHPHLRTISENNGNFKVNIQELCKSARGAMYTLLGSTSKYASGNLRVLPKLFDRMILPISTYNYEVWRSTFFTRKFVPSDFLSKQQLKNAVDKLHCVFIKQILGVNLKASYWGILSETNRSSPIPGIMMRMISFWQYLQDSPSPITQETVKLLKALHEKNHNSWFTGLSKIAKVLGETGDFLASTAYRKSALRRIVENQWYSSQVKHSLGKLRLYRTLKELPGFETYLSLNNPKLQQNYSNKTTIRIRIRNIYFSFYYMLSKTQL